MPYSNDNAVVSIAISNDTNLNEGYRAPVNGMAEVPKQLAKNFTYLGGKYETDLPACKIYHIIQINNAVFVAVASI